ncbi:leucine-rich repeat neuronal protein 4-like [Xyrauchen texanus]|uniref:leucine-rich repeat neuronal protein 4-like n=1 Tax=Xyrauchen texanus TaxID=154827 RepID=UPI002241CF8D|nr:leucine-rich repeat neuronal protein 4-like [Xyrauchen texanus]
MMPDSQVTFLLLFLLETICAASVGLSLLQPPVTRVRITEVEDYDDEVTSKMTLAPKLPSLTTTRGVPQLCDYNPCVAQTSPCIEIATHTGCLCPGLTGPEVRPGAPKLREVKLDHSGEVIVHWCAPLSNVTHYKVTLKGRQGQEWVYGEFLRNGAVPELKVGEAVCVAAVNQAGVSEEECAPYEPPQPDQATMSAGIIAGCIGFLVLVSLVVVLLWRRRCRKGSMGEGEGLGNPTYTNDGAL